MAKNWEYKVITVKRPGTFTISDIPEDADLTTVLNRKGAQGWELANALGYGPINPVRL